MSVRGAGGRSTVRRVSRRRAAFHHPVSPKERAPRLRKPGGAAVEQNLGILKSEPAKAIVLLLLIEYRVKSDRHLSCERHDLDISHVRTVDPVPAIAQITRGCALHGETDEAAALREVQEETG